MVDVSAQSLSPGGGPHRDVENRQSGPECETGGPEAGGGVKSPSSAEDTFPTDSIAIAAITLNGTMFSRKGHAGFSQIKRSSLPCPFIGSICGAGGSGRNVHMHVAWEITFLMTHNILPL